MMVKGLAVLCGSYFDCCDRSDRVLRRDALRLSVGRVATRMAATAGVTARRRSVVQVFASGEAPRE